MEMSGCEIWLRYLFQSCLTDRIVFDVELFFGTFHHTENTGPLHSSILRQMILN